MSQKKNFQREKIFKTDIFVLKHVFDHFKSISTKKNFNFLVTNFSKKQLCPWKKFLTGKIFKIDIFILKSVLDDSNSIPTKKFFFEKFSIFWSFLPFLGPKIDFMNFLWGEILKIFLKDCIVVILRYYMHPYVYRALQGH